MSRGPIEILKVVEVDGSPQIKLIEESLRYVKETSSDAVESQTIAFLGNTQIFFCMYYKLEKPDPLRRRISNS